MIPNTIQQVVKLTVRKNLPKYKKKIDEILKVEVKELIKTEEFKSFKTILETGAAAGTIITIFYQFNLTNVSKEQMAELVEQGNVLKEKIEKLTQEFSDLELFKEQWEIEHETSDKAKEEMAEKIKSQEKQLNEKDKIIEHNQKVIKRNQYATGSLTAVIIGIILYSLVKPTQSLELIEEFFQNQN